MRLLLIQIQFRQQTSDALLELAVLGGVDERVDDAVAQHHRLREDVVPAREVDSLPDKVDNQHDLVWRVAYDETAAYHQRRDGRVASGCAQPASGIGSHLKITLRYL